MKFVRSFFSDLMTHRRLIFELAKKDFTSAYTGSALGFFWSLLEPMVYISIMWVFFTQAARYSPSGHFPFIVWLMTNMIFWYFISGAITNTSRVFRGHSFMLKRWQFNMSILPVVGIISTFFNHLIFVIILFAIYMVSGIPLSLYWFQALYYIFAASMLIVGLSWITSSLSLFFKDVSNVIAILLQLGFWLSPIFWDIDSFPVKYKIFVKLNPLYYVMAGYRNSFLNDIPFWSDTYSMVYFWLFTGVVWTTGAFTYKRLRPHFGEVI